MALDLFGLPIPQIVRDRALHDFFEESHMISSYLLAALIVVHIAGSLRHHFIKRNTVMRRMWFGTTDAEAPARPLVQGRFGSSKKHRLVNPPQELGPRMPS